jgi:CheY-like chemotaxis protein
VESAAGRGATFTFTFAGTRTSPHSEVPVVASFEGVHVLAQVGSGIVGDQLRWMLSHWGVRVTVAPPGEVISVAADAFDVLIVDADAAGSGAQPSAVRTPAHLAGLPAIAVTRMPAVAAADLEPARQTIGKPVRFRALDEALRRALRIPPTLAPADSVPAAAPFARAALKILLVEDNASNRRVVQMMLAELGLEDVDQAESGREAVTRARARDYDVILMDLQMPGLDGLEATRRIRTDASRNRPVILALTANVMQGEERRCRDAGMDGYLPKPLRLDSLASALSELAS